MVSKKTEYVLFCDQCGFPQLIPNYILQAYIASGVDGVYCQNCKSKIVVPEYIRKIAGEL